jgi:hypothetical protein
MESFESTIYEPGPDALSSIRRRGFFMHSVDPRRISGKDAVSSGLGIHPRVLENGEAQMKSNSIGTILRAVFLSWILPAGAVLAQLISGRVYDGAVGVETTPISGVTVTLYGSNNSGSLGTTLKTATTDATGWYGFHADSLAFEYYIIVETDPSGYGSAGASSVDGTVVNSNQIQFTYPLTGKTLTGNKFWDRTRQSGRNHPPVADAGGPYISYVGNVVTLDGSGSYDPDAASGDYIASYQWVWRDFTGSDEPLNPNPSAGDVTIAFFPAYTGIMRIALTVEDDSGETDTDSATVIMGVQLKGTVYEGASGVETTPLSGVSLSLYGSDDRTSPGDPLATATTDAAGDYTLISDLYGYAYYNIIETDPSGYGSSGATSGGGTVIHSNRIQYQFPTTIVSGNKFYDQRTGSGANNPPVAEAGGPYSAIGPMAPVHVDGSASYDPDTGDAIVQYDWQDVYPNGTTVTFMTGVKSEVTWVPPLAGTHTIRLTVTDSHGAQGTDTAELTIGDGSQGTGVVSGVKFNDLNGNHHRDAGEPGLGGWEIYYAHRDGGGYETTEPDGSYSIKHLPADTCRIYEASQAGWTQTCPTGGFYKVTLSEGQALGGIDFGNTQSAVRPGEIDAGDAPAPYPEASDSLGGAWLGSTPPDAENGMQRTAHASGDDEQGIDDEDGIRFTGGKVPRGGIAVGEMEIHIPTTIKSDYKIGLWIDYNQDGDWDDPVENDDNAGQFFLNYTGFSGGSSIPFDFCYSGPMIRIPATAKTGKTFGRMRIYGMDIDPANENVFTPSGSGGPGEVEDFEVEIVDAGETLPPGGFLGGSKFDDLNGNGLRDAVEPGLPGWQIWLDLNGNGTLDSGEPTTTTDSNGMFTFTGLADGNYLVNETLQSGWVQTCPGSPASPDPYSVTLKNGSVNPFTAIVFGNRRTQTPGGSRPGEGNGAVKWIQPPLFNPDHFQEGCYDGWGERSQEGVVTLADDWFCYNDRPVTSITWWGTYAGWDSIAPPPDAPQRFRIGLWTAKPKGEGNAFDRPDRMIRDWLVDRSWLGETADRSHRMPEWRDSRRDTCFRYTFPIAPPEWFTQQGDSNVYWLSIAAVYAHPPGEHAWGWLTRERYFNADAVRIIAPAAPCTDSLYRAGDPLQPACRDMAFMLGTDRNTALTDFGDAADGYGTSFSHNGAVHLIRGDIRLGTSEDVEDDGTPDPDAIHDDTNGSDDEDGVIFLDGLIPGKMIPAAVTVSGHGFLSVWLDVGRNGLWDPRDRVLADVELAPGGHVVEFPVADDASPGGSVMRFRFSSRPGVWVKGFAPDGEVEDYAVEIQRPVSDAEAGRNGRLPGSFRLYPNYPNPFNPVTTIRFDLPAASRVRLAVYNLLGQEIRVLTDRSWTGGSHELQWEGRDSRGSAVPAGVYLVRLDSGPFRAARKLLFLK